MLAPPPISTLFPYTTLFRSYAATPTLVLMPSPWPGGNRTTPSWRCLLPVDGLPTSASRISPVCPHLLSWVSSSLLDRKSTRLNSSHQIISYAVFCLKKKNIH